MMISEHMKYVILFDGVCNLCNRAVQFLIRNDRHDRFVFVSLQSETAKQLAAIYGFNAGSMDTVIYIRKAKVYSKSSAWLMMLNDLGGWWKSAGVLYILPKRFRDFLYDLVAGSRYRIFGKRDEC